MKPHARPLCYQWDMGIWTLALLAEAFLALAAMIVLCRCG